eukprot:scaffold4940_cov163-Amphora_coffeaeformis.AAC.12
MMNGRHASSVAFELEDSEHGEIGRHTPLDTVEQIDHGPSITLEGDDIDSTAFVCGKIVQ